MAQRKTSAKIAKTAAKLLKNLSSNKPVKKVAGSALSQRAPQPKRGKKIKSPGLHFFERTTNLVTYLSNTICIALQL